MPIVRRAAVAGLVWLLVACAAPAASPATPAPTCPPNGTPGRPEDALLTDANGDDHAGELGGYTYCGGSLGGDWPDPATLAATVSLPADEVNVVIATELGPPFVGWQAQYADPNGPASPVSLTTGTSNGSESVSFAGPPTGEWVLAVTLVYAGDIGHATFYWRITAP